MFWMIADAQVAQVRKRAREGDCPITESLSVESLEDLVLHLAGPEPKIPSTKINPDAFSSVRAVVRAADMLVDSTVNGGESAQEVCPAAWNELSAALLILRGLIPNRDQPADPAHAVTLFWPDAPTLCEGANEDEVLSAAIADIRS